MDQEKWKLAFEDTFEGDGLDPAKWSLRTENGRDCEQRRGGYWDRDHVFVRDGKLVIRTEYTEKGKCGPGYYTAAISTDGLFDHVFGYYEIRCILPKGEGLWASFWMQSNAMRVPGQGTDGGRKGAEIDIFEAAYYKYPQMRDFIASSVHVDGAPPLLKSKRVGSFPAREPYDRFNTYGLEWTPEEYIFYINGKETCRTGFLKGTSRVPEYMILSVEVCGVGGKPSEDWAGLITRNPAGTLPSDFIVDSVRVYDRA